MKPLSLNRNIASGNRELESLTLPVPIPEEEKKKASKAFIKPFEALKRSVKIKT